MEKKIGIQDIVVSNKPHMVQVTVRFSYGVRFSSQIEKKNSSKKGIKCQNLIRLFLMV